MDFIDQMRNRFKMGKAGPPAILTRRPREEAERASDDARQATERVKDADKNVRKTFKP